MGVDVKLNLGGRRIKADNIEISLDPNIIRIVKLLARQAAEEDFKKAIEKHKN